MGTDAGKDAKWTTTDTCPCQSASSSGPCHSHEHTSCRTGGNTYSEGPTTYERQHNIPRDVQVKYNLVLERGSLSKKTHLLGLAVPGDVNVRHARISWIIPGARSAGFGPFSRDHALPAGLGAVVRDGVDDRSALFRAFTSPVFAAFCRGREEDEEREDSNDGAEELHGGDALCVVPVGKIMR